MTFINYATREINCKIVYYGPGLGGKTTNLQYIYNKTAPESKGKMISLATEADRTLFFDFLPLDLGSIRGFTTRFHLYTVPGQVYYRLSRRAVLTGADGIVFVADSHPARERANRDSLADLEEQLLSLGLSSAQTARIPRVFQWNKRDLRAALPVERLRLALNPAGAPEIEAVACEGQGVGETLKAGCKAVLARLAAPAAQTPQTSAAPAPGQATGQPASA